MAITYPISLPSSPPPARLVLRRRDIVGATESIFTGQVQVHKHQGEWWEAEVILPPLTRSEAAQWDAAIESLRGSYGTFLLGDASRTTAQGTPVGSPAVDGASQTGTQLATKDWNGVAQGSNLGFETGDFTGWLEAPDFSVIGTDPRSGAWHLEVATTSSAAADLMSDPEFSVIEGDRVDVAGWVKESTAAAPTMTIAISVRWSDSGGSTISLSAATLAPGGAAAGQYAQLSVSAQAPATAVSARVNISTGNGVDGQWWVDDITVTHYSAATGLLLPGDYIQLGSGSTQRLHRVLTQVDCDQTGAATLDIWPRLRESPADGELLVLSNTQGVFRLAGPTEVERLPGGFTRLSFRCREAI